MVVVVVVVGGGDEVHSCPVIKTAIEVVRELLPNVIIFSSSFKFLIIFTCSKAAYPMK